GAPFAFCCGALAQLRAFDAPAAWRREGPDRNEKLFIQSGLRLGLPAGFGGLAAAAFSGGCSWRTGWAHRRTRTYWSWYRTAIIPSRRCSTRTVALRIPGRTSR